MNKNIHFLIIIFFISQIEIFAQTNVSMKIHHKLGDALFELSTATQNNIEHDFNVTRLQYYISEITLIHDNGIETPVPDTWLLVNAGKLLEVDLGDFDITNLEQIDFYIGVDPDHNHEDPASYLPTHPLAPQLPSMHWGWVSGYRFVAYEGYGGSGFNQTFQLHGLGDSNYFKVEIPIEMEATNNQLYIQIDADYARGLENLEMNAGVVVHGEEEEAKQCLENFRDYVFSPTTITTSIDDFEGISSFSVFPNPTINRQFSVSGDGTLDYKYDYSITNLLGQEVRRGQLRNNDILNLTLSDEGIYFVNLLKDGQLVETRKMIVR